jgi:hypothetical protein
MITHDVLLTLLDYNPETGHFTWLAPLSTRVFAGSVAGGITTNGYVQLGVLGKRYHAHRLAWFYQTGQWPTQQIDHINGIRHDNRWENLREVSNHTNARNRRQVARNQSGITGVFWDKRRNNWRAEIKSDGRCIYIGAYQTLLDAVAARLRANRQHGFSTRHGDTSPAPAFAPPTGKRPARKTGAPTYALMHQLFYYDPTTGCLIRRKVTGANTRLGAIAGSLNKDGYRNIYLNGALYPAHRLIWLYHYGRFPPQELDHINRIRDDNRIENLREASRSENMRNTNQVHKMAPFVPLRAYVVRPIAYQTAQELLIRHHYLHRRAPCKHAFGLFLGDDLLGVITYAVPASPTLRNGLAGPKHRDNCYELTRLWVADSVPHSGESFLIGRSLRLLDREYIVAYADSDQGHTGTVYRASNFLFTGMSAQVKNWTVAGEPGHSLNAVKGRTKQEMIDTYGDRFSLQPRSRKHRFVYIRAKGTRKKELLNELRYAVVP